jgi:hypothetical protein
MSKHTPGPWKAEWGTFRLAGQPDRLNQCVIGTPKNSNGGQIVTTTIRGPLHDIEEAKANAHLIAAAPDLLQAAKNMVQQLRAEFGPHFEATALERAIEKAEGRA